MSKHKLSLLLLVVFVGSIGISVVAGAEELPYGLKSGKPYAGTKLVYLLPHAGQYNSHAKRTKEFTEMTGIEVEYQFVPFPNLKEKITADGVLGSGEVDLYNYLDSWGPSIKNFLVPLDDMIKEAGIDMNRYPPAFVKGHRYEGTFYGIPVRGHPQLMFYRKDIFEQLGLEVPTTWAELEDVANTITEKTDLYGVAMYYGKGYSGQNLYVWYAYLWSNGGDIFDENWKPIFNNEAGIEATQRYIDLMLKHKATAPGSAFFSEYEASQSVSQNESAIVILWWWHVGNMRNPEKSQEIVVNNMGFAPVPAWEGKRKATFALSMAAAISAHSKNQEAAWEFIKWLSNPDLEKQVVIDKSDPKTMAIVAVQTKNLKDPEVNATSDGMHAAAAESLANSNIMPMFSEWPEVMTALEVAISEIAGGKPVKEQLDKAAKEVEQIMKRAGFY